MPVLLTSIAYKTTQQAQITGGQKMTCKGLCDKYTRKHRHHTSRYGGGQKRCKHCSVFLVWDGVFCPCCGYRLKTGPKASYRARILKGIPA